MSSWDQRYQGLDYAFGTEAHVFLKQVAHQLPHHGLALDVGCGEGRNAVFLAQHGLSVLAIDQSAVGLDKAQALAAACGVSIQTERLDLTNWQAPTAHYSVISWIWVHLAEPQRSQVLQQMVQALAPGGYFVGVLYHPKQLQHHSGGPQDPARLADIHSLQQALHGLKWRIAEHRQIMIDEGSRHQGLSEVIHLLGCKS